MVCSSFLKVFDMDYTSYIPKNRLPDPPCSSWRRFATSTPLLGLLIGLRCLVNPCFFYDHEMAQKLIRSEVEEHLIVLRSFHRLVVNCEQSRHRFSEKLCDTEVIIPKGNHWAILYTIWLPRSRSLSISEQNRWKSRKFCFTCVTATKFS